MIASGSIESLVDHLRACGVTIEEGPVARTGALGPITSVYIRDPDGTLIELSSYHVSQRRHAAPTRCNRRQSAPAVEQVACREQHPPSCPLATVDRD